MLSEAFLDRDLRQSGCFKSAKHSLRVFGKVLGPLVRQRETPKDLGKLFSAPFVFEFQSNLVRLADIEFGK